MNILPNFRAGGSWGSTPPPFKEGDTAWTGAPIAEIPDLGQMRIDMKVEEVDRGKIQLGQSVQDPRGCHSGQGVHGHAGLDQPYRIRWSSGASASRAEDIPSARNADRGRSTAASGYERLGRNPDRKPGGPAADSIQSQLLAERQTIGMGCSGQQFEVRPIEVGKRNETDIVVLKGLQRGRTRRSGESGGSRQASQEVMRTPGGG